MAAGPGRNGRGPVAAIAALDDSYARGELDESDYRARRGDLAARALGLATGGSAAGDDGGGDGYAADDDDATDAGGDGYADGDGYGYADGDRDDGAGR